MKKKGNDFFPKVTPGRLDLRRRSGNFVGLWVVNRTWSKDKSCVESCGVMESIVRSVYQLEGREGNWVRYHNSYHPLHSAEEFSVILANAKKRKFKYGFFHNGLGGNEDATMRTEPAYFIYCDEHGPWAGF